MKIKKKGVWKSWNENIQHSYENLYQITTEAELQKIIKESEKVRFFGNKQSSADIGAGINTLIDIRSYDKILSYNEEQKHITVQAGIKLVDLIEAVEAKGWCIPCLPDINTVTLGGALATGTHGTSGKLLASYVHTFRVILADGSLKEITEKEELMDAFRVSLGVLGVYSTVTFACEPIYTLHVKEGPQKDSHWLENISDNLTKFDFLRILWLPHTGKGYQITGEKIPAEKEISENLGPKYLQYRRSFSKLLYRYTHIFPWITAIANKILGRLFFSSKRELKGSLYQATVTKSRGSTIELAEWTVDLAVFPQVFQELKKTINQWSNNSFIHIPMDVRFLEKDSSWLSYAYGQDTVTMGCVSRNASTADSYEAFITIEKIFIKYGGRPHWGKRFEAKDAQLNEIYPKWNDFKNCEKSSILPINS